MPISSAAHLPKASITLGHTSKTQSLRALKLDSYHVKSISKQALLPPRPEELRLLHIRMESEFSFDNLRLIEPEIREQKRVKFLNELQLKCPELIQQFNQIYQSTVSQFKITEKLFPIMKQVLERLHAVPILEVHEEAQMDAAFQEAEQKLQQEGISYHELRSQHDMILRENHFIRQATQDLNAFYQLSLEGKKRAILFLAEHCFRTLRVESFLQALKFPALLPSFSQYDPEGNLKLETRQYQIGRSTALLLKSYCEEAILRFELHQKQPWLSKDIYLENQTILKQLEAIIG